MVRDNGCVADARLDEMFVFSGKPSRCARRLFVCTTARAVPLAIPAGFSWSGLATSTWTRIRRRGSWCSIARARSRSHSKSFRAQRRERFRPLCRAGVEKRAWPMGKATPRFQKWFDAGGRATGVMRVSVYLFGILFNDRGMLQVAADRGMGVVRALECIQRTACCDCGAARPFFCNRRYCLCLCSVVTGQAMSLTWYLPTSVTCAAGSTIKHSFSGQM
jgi:hypothetical protein